MTVLMEPCPACNGTGRERFAFSSIPFQGSELPCWTCDGNGEVPSQVNIGWDLGQEILDARARHGKAAA